LAAQTTISVNSQTVTLSSDQAVSIQVTANADSTVYTVTGVPSWLSVTSTNNFTTPDTLAFRLQSSLCGACTTLLTLTPAAGGVAASVTVAYNPNGGPGGATLAANPVSLSLSAPAGLSTTQMVTVSTSAGSPITIASLFANQSWLTASLSAFVVSAGSPAILTVTANAAGYSNTILNGQVVVTPAAGTSLTIPVQFSVTGGSSGGNATVAAPPSLTFAYELNQSAPPYQLITVAPLGAFSAVATVGTPQQWLSVSPGNGTGPALVLVSINPQGLTAGSYPGTISISTPSGSQTIAVNLLVSNTTVLNALPGSINTTTAATAGPVNYPVQLTSSDGSNQPVTVTSPNNWITVVSTSSPNTPATATIQVNPSSLCNGLNSGSVVATAGAANSPLSVPVAVLVTSGASATCGTAPAPQLVNPGAGSGYGQTMVFTFNDSGGYQGLDVVNILINNSLNGAGACYLAYSQTGGILYLVNDAGTGLLPGIPLNGTGNLTNSQCTISGAGSYASGTGSVLTLVLNMSFTPGFAGNKIVYMAARDVSQNNSGWQPLGTWNVPSVTGVVGPGVGGITPARGSGLNPSFIATFTDTNGVQDLGVVNILINSSLDGRQACYLAYSVPLNVLYVVNDTGTGLSPGITPGGAGSAGNSQCSLNAAGFGVGVNSNNVVLTLPLTFTSAFDGNKVIYLAARSVGDVATSGWQAVGSWTVQ
jgi:hypothetical protein